MSFVSRAVVMSALLLTTAASVSPSFAQVAAPGDRRAGIRPDGFVLEAGLASPIHGDNTVLLGVSAGMGTLLWRNLDFSVDLRRWSADLDRSDFGSSVDGSFSDLSLGMSLRLPLMKVAGLRPYVATGLAGHVVGASVPGDRSLEDALSGFTTGAHAAFGLATTADGLGMRIQARRDFVDDVGAWTVTAGFGWWPKRRAVAPHGGHASVRNPAVYQSTPAIAATQSAGGPSIRDLTLALNHLKAENRELAAEIAAVRSEVRQLKFERAVEVAAAARQPVVDAARPVVTAAPVVETPAPVAAAPAPVAETPAVVAEAVSSPDQVDELFDALARVAAQSGNPGALRRDGRSGLLTLNQSLLFGSGEWELKTEAREELLRYAVVLLRYPEAEIVVQGHTDTSGRAAWNQTLSERRAQAVRAELVRLGVEPTRLTAVGYGSSRPIGDNDTPASRARNRRVDLLVTLSDHS